jgi:hypothetical protein
MSDQDLTEAYDLHPEFFTRHLRAALYRWRESPSQSAVGILNFIEPEAPQGNGSMFPSMREQTRVIGALIYAGAIAPSHVRALTKDKRIVRISGSAASTLDEDGQAAFDLAARGFSLWALRNRAKAKLGMVKVPRILFRGLRSFDINIEDLGRERSDVPYHNQCQVHLAKRTRLLGSPLSSVAGSQVLSFTATRSIAEYFTGDEGFVVELTHDQFDVLGAWCLDEPLSGPDPSTGRQEREWIIRVHPNHQPTKTTLASRDRAFCYATRDPSGIEMLHHHYHAQYVLDGRKVTASFHYNASGRGGRVNYAVDDQFPETRRTTKTKTGFDPVPGPGRAATDLIYFSQDPWQSKRTIIARFEIPDDALNLF